MISSESNNASVLFLHGAIHLLRTTNENSIENTYKIIRDKNSDLDLRQIKKILLDHSKEFDNLIVAGGGSKEKINQIYNNYYLKKCLGKLNNSKGIFLVYGCNLIGFKNITTDEHIWREVLANATLLYIGLHLAEGETLDSKANELKKVLEKLYIGTQKEVVCFNTKKNNIWQDKFWRNDSINLKEPITIVLNKII